MPQMITLSDTQHANLLELLERDIKLTHKALSSGELRDPDQIVTADQRKNTLLDLYTTIVHGPKKGTPVERCKASDPDGPGTLHIMRLPDNDLTPYVVCHNWNGESWDWGTYCETYERAIEVFQAKLVESGYLPRKDEDA